jgi:hypothetical protein
LQVSASSHITQMCYIHIMQVNCIYASWVFQTNYYAFHMT